MNNERLQERIEYLERFVYGTPEAKELFSYERDRILNKIYRPSYDDPHNEMAKIAMAVLEVYQHALRVNKQLTESENGRTDTSGQPSID